MRIRRCPDSRCSTTDCSGLEFLAQNGGVNVQLLCDVIGQALTLNPAGYIFLKNLIVHFEFYSALGGNPQALFMQGAARTERNHRFEFEETISRVLRLVKRHSEAMKKFFDHKFVRGRFMTNEDYLKSDFVFKHFGQIAPVERGLFHANRVVFTHINYIDIFRLWLLARSKQLEHSVRVDINRKLVGFLERYLKVAEDWINSLGGRNLEQANTYFVPVAGSDVFAFGSCVGNARRHLNRIIHPGRPRIYPQRGRRSIRTTKGLESKTGWRSHYCIYRGR